MKKLIALCLLLAFVLTGCAGKPESTADITENPADIMENSADIMENSADIPELGEVSNYTQEQLEEKLIGLSIEETHNLWGEPDSCLSGLWGDTWYLKDEQNQQITVYYDKDGIVENIICSPLDGEMVSNEVKWEYMHAVSSRYPAMALTFAVSCQEITVTCDNGTLIDFDNYDDSIEGYPKGKSLTIQNAGRLYWAPWGQDDDILAVSSAEITFTVLGEENTVLNEGTLVIKQIEETEFGWLYSAILEDGSGLTLTQDEHQPGGILG